ncbi:MAG: hypothetical protein O3B13_09115 [Planctomycetota bacterium]|nr:hypothetical protein [Planctomycetota bacterium]MDA1163248.1 hypothetical protein [Planctomycetota bacterium]
MRAIVGAILIFAASVLVGAGIIAHALDSTSSGHAEAGYFLGGLLAVGGIAHLMVGPLKRDWDAIPVNGVPPKTDE